jgi:hypothetical protein
MACSFPYSIWQGKNISDYSCQPLVKAAKFLISHVIFDQGAGGGEVADMHMIRSIMQRCP